MNSTYGIAVGLLVAIVVVVFILKAIAQKQVKRKADKMQLLLAESVKQHNLVLHHREALGYKTLGIDLDKSMLVYIDTYDSDQVHVLDLNGHKSCKVVNTGNSIPGTTKNSTIEYYNGIHLQIALQSGDIINLPIYNEIQDGMSEKNNLRKIAEKWKEYITG